MILYLLLLYVINLKTKKKPKQTNKQKTSKNNFYNKINNLLTKLGLLNVSAI